MKEPQIFFCCASEDEEIVGDIYDRLKIEGFHPWLDGKDILPGQDWDWETRKALQVADLILVFFSKTSVFNRGYVQRKFKLALESRENIPEGQIFIIPIRLNDCELPEQFHRFKHCDLFEDNGFEKVLQSIKAGIKQLKTIDTINAKVPQAAQPEQHITSSKRDNRSYLPDNNQSSGYKQAKNTKSGDNYSDIEFSISQHQLNSSKQRRYQFIVALWISIFAGIATILTFLTDVGQKIEAILYPESTRFVGKVINQNNIAVVGANIKVFEVEGEKEPLRVGSTKEDGKFNIRVKAKAEETVWVVITKDKHKRFEGYLKLVGNNEILLEELLRFGRVAIQSTPLGAIVEIDGRVRGKTPLHIDSLSEGSHLARVRKDGYQSQEKRIKIIEGEESLIDFPLRPYELGALELKGVPSAAIFVNGERKSLQSNTSIEVFVLGNTKHKIVFANSEYGAATIYEIVPAGGHKTITCYFEDQNNIRFGNERGSAQTATVMIDKERKTVELNK